MESLTKILICDENNEERKTLVEALTRSGYRFISEAEDGECALELALGGGYDLIITDMWLRGIDGIGIIKEASRNASGATPAFILLSPTNKQSLLVDASEAGADVCIIKPFELSTFVSRVDRKSVV